MNKYTIKLGKKQWETTNFHECVRFVFSFSKGQVTEYSAFKMSSAPHSGAEIPTVINVN
jgi:hypothetical protein